MTSHCVGCWDNEGNAYSGGQNGQVYVWVNRQCTKNVTGSKRGFVSAIRCAEGSLFVGGKDGCVTVFALPDLSVTKSVAFDSMIRAIDCMNGNMLVGTRNGSIYHCAGGDMKEIMASHHEGEVWGLDVCGTDVATSCDDNQVIVWDSVACKKKCAVTVSTEKRTSKKGGASTLSALPASQCSRAVIFKPDGGLIVAANDGRVHIWDSTTASAPSKTLSDAAEWIECMALNADGSKLAVGSHDNNIYVYNTADWDLCGTLSKHSSYIMALDWSTDSKFIRSNCGAYELLFWDMDSMSQDTSGKTNSKDCDWCTSTVKFGWHVQGVYPKGTDGTHVNRVNQSADGQYLVTGDDWCLMRVFNNPCLTGHRPRSYRGHSEFVTNCVFAGDKIFSVGGYDQTLMQWK